MRYIVINKRLPSRYLTAVPASRSLPYGSHTLPTLPLRLPHAYHRIAMMRLTTE